MLIERRVRIYQSHQFSLACSGQVTEIEQTLTHGGDGPHERVAVCWPYGF